MKSKETANTVRLEGNTSFRRKQNDKALEQYNQVSFLVSWRLGEIGPEIQAVVTFVFLFHVFTSRPFYMHHMSQQMQMTQNFLLDLQTDLLFSFTRRNTA